MDGKSKHRLELRYYTLPEHEPVLALLGEDWVCPYRATGREQHFHNLMELGVCRWGEGEMALGDRRIVYQSGAMTLIPANFPHETLSHGGQLNSWEYLFFDPEAILKKAFGDDPLFVQRTVQQLNRCARCLSASDGQSVRRLALMVMDEYRAAQDYHCGMVQSLMTALLLQAARLEKENDAQPSVEANLPQASVGLRQIEPAMQHIDAHYMEAVSIETLVQLCLLSEAQLRRKFREYLNMSPSEYLTAVRIRHACELLNTTACSMPEISLRVGYQSISAFDRSFRRLMGMSPYRYKKSSENYRGHLLDFDITARKGWLTSEETMPPKAQKEQTAKSTPASFVESDKTS